MSAEIREVFRRHATQVLTKFNRITWLIDDMCGENPIPDGYRFEMWYPHREGHDDNREPICTGTNKARIRRLMAQERTNIQTVVDSMAERLPEYDITLHLVDQGEYTYHITPKK